MKLTIRYGQASFKNRSSKVLSSSIDSEGNSTPIASVLKHAGHLGQLMSNGSNTENGQFYGATYEYMDDGAFIILKHIQKFANSVVCSSILPLRLRTTGPMVIVKGVFPFMKGFAHQDDLMLFSGRADVLSYDELFTLNMTDFLTEYEINMGFDAEDRVACYGITERWRNISGYQPRPEFVTVEYSDGESAGVVLPKPHRRRVRVGVSSKATDKAPPPSRKRRRRTT